MKPPAYFVDSMALVGFRFTKCVSVATQPSRPLTNSSHAFYLPSATVIYLLHGASACAVATGYFGQ